MDVAPYARVKAYGSVARSSHGIYAAARAATPAVSATMYMNCTQPPTS